ncbi:MAG: 2-oxoacid:acceptor oxidoreductase subunit alpha [Leptolinea sp.]|nr:2-oxoacid:acceptor oxidoreductase subunit alpha [Leptolinea sp.]
MNQITNEFNLTISTVNGSGSATANVTILRSIFNMGIPVSGINIFPSNIQGQPTWYSMRISQAGYLARQEKDDIVVAMNPVTIQKEIDSVCPGGVLLFADHIHLPVERPDIHIYSMPVKKIIQESEIMSSVRDYVANMVYVGVLAQILGMDLDLIHQALDFHFKSRESAVNVNWKVVKNAANWATEKIIKEDPYRVQSLSPLSDYILVDGNTAAALGAIYGGVQFNAWYPITPATSVSESLNEYLPQLRLHPETGKESYVVVQAEDELSAIGMTVGAGYAGLRAMTSTSGPGLSLMSEYLGLAYYAEVPVVIWDVQRIGPSTGLPTRTAQGDLTQSYFISHGDTQFIILLPGSVTECFEFGWKAFDLAERMQMPVIVLSDLELGMNQWMTRKFSYPDKPMDRGKILWEDDLEKLLDERSGDWGRYLDIDGDGIPYRTVIGNTHPKSAFFSRGTGHDEYARYSEDNVTWEKGLKRLGLKYETAKKFVPKPCISNEEDAEIRILSFGSTDPAIKEAIDQFHKKGNNVDYCRVRSIPFSTEVKDFLNTKDPVYVVEINRDGQMCQLLQTSFPEYASKLVKMCHVDGLALTANWIVENIQTSRENQNA